MERMRGVPPVFTASRRNRVCVCLTLPARRTVFARPPTDCSAIDCPKHALCPCRQPRRQRLTYLVDRDKYDGMGFMQSIGGVLLGALALGVPISSSAVTVTVDFAVQEGPISHRANGYLVSVEPDSPSQELIEPLRPTSFRGSVGYVFRNYERLRRLGVDEFQVTLGLVFGEVASSIFNINRIGESDDYGPWIAHVHRIVDEVERRKLSVMWDIYNEPDLANVPIGNNDRLKKGWELAYRIIKERLPGARIVGPSVAYYSALRPFLKWSRDQQVFPDVVAYHEYGDPSGASAYLNDLREFLRTNDLPRPISVNEILGQDYWMIPGYTAGVLAAYERAGIQSAMRSCWPDVQDTSRLQRDNTCENPTLDGLLHVDRQSKRPGWHIYKTYADMQGDRVSAVTDSPRLHALASADAAQGVALLLMGKFDEQSGDETNLIVRSLSQLPFLAGAAGVRVYGERIPDVGSGPLEALPVTLDACLPVREDQAQVTLTEFARLDAYRVTISPCDVPETSVMAP